MTRPDQRSRRWPTWKLGLLLYPFAAGAVAINLFLLALIGRALDLGTLQPGAALVLGVILGIPAALWAGRRLRRLMDQADPPDQG